MILVLRRCTQFIDGLKRSLALIDTGYHKQVGGARGREVAANQRK